MSAVVVEMQNPNVLIAMAHVSENSDNPYYVFCEYIKYCIFMCSSSKMTITEIKEAVGKEFGLRLPNEIILRCLGYIKKEGLVREHNHCVIREGTFDVKGFDEYRTTFRLREESLIEDLIKYVEQFGKIWERDYARKQLIKVLDEGNLAHDIFIYGTIKAEEDCSVHKGGPDNGFEDELLNGLNLGDGTAQENEVASIPLFEDVFFVGKFIQGVLSENSLRTDFLKQICEGLMICSAAYQLPSADHIEKASSIKGTLFCFDTRLLLRFVGCAHAAAVESARELVGLIRSAGGIIGYYPHTLQEMTDALKEAVRSLRRGFPPGDNEMRMYALSVKNDHVVINAKCANLEEELSSFGIYVCPLQNHSETERLKYGFSRESLHQYMSTNLNWEPQTIEYDALSIWETHMSRQGNYKDYCGSKDKLRVFVTTNTKLVDTILDYKNRYSDDLGVRGWRNNALPVITAMRLTCRLWNPSTQSERLPILYLAANAVAAQRPTPQYISRVKNLVSQFRTQLPAYSGISLAAYFDDVVTEALLYNAQGKDENLDIATFASTITEMAEWRAREQEFLTEEVANQRDDISQKLEKQIEEIINGAVEQNRNALGWRALIIYAILYWPIMIESVFLAITSLFREIVTWGALPIFAIPIVLFIAEKVTSSNFVIKWLIQIILPKIEKSFEKKIERKLRKVELQYKTEIVNRVKEQTHLLKKVEKFKSTSM